jgi:16S rRNA (uracil1498-N3)-methyltransferase
MDLTVRQATELGLARIIPLESEYSTVRLEGAAREAKRRRWQRIARSAIEQSGRLSLPIIEAPLELEGALGLVGDCGPLLFFWEEPGGSALDDVLAATREEDGAAVSEAVILIGPEGGFSATEAELVQMAGAHTVTLGDAILRTETAALVASALVLYRLGGLGA